MPRTITQCYLPPGRGDIPALRATVVYRMSLPPQKSSGLLRNAASLLWSRNVVKMKVFVAARCPSVCLSQHGPTAATRVSPAGRRYRSAAARRAAANAGSATLSAAVGGWTQTCLCESSETVNSFVLLEQCRNKSQIYAKREQVLTATLSASCTRPPAEMVIFIHRKIRLQQ